MTFNQNTVKYENPTLIIPIQWSKADIRNTDPVTKCHIYFQKNLKVYNRKSIS